MSQILFFNSNDSINKIYSKIFISLNVSDVYEGDSTHYINETYYQGEALGLISIRIAENNYGYENKFRYMMIIKRSRRVESIDENVLFSVGKIIASAVAIKLDISTAMEIGKVDSGIFLYFSKSKEELLVEEKTLDEIKEYC